MGEGVDRAAVHAALHIAAAVLLGKHHGHLQLHGRRRRDGDAAGLDGQDLVDSRAGIQAGDLFSHLPEEAGVDPLVEEGAHLQHPAGEHLALGADFFFHQTHIVPSLPESKRQTLYSDTKACRLSVTYPIPVRRSAVPRIAGTKPELRPSRELKMEYVNRPIVVTWRWDAAVGGHGRNIRAPIISEPILARLMKL